MGFYLNPKGISKENFLCEYGVQVPPTTPYEQCPEGCLPVVLLDNGLFTAAGIAYSAREYGEFVNPRDTRPKTVFFVDKKVLKDAGCSWPGSN